MSDLKLQWAARGSSDEQDTGLKLGWAASAASKQRNLTKERETRERAEARVSAERAGGGAGQLAGDLAWQAARGTPVGSYLDEAAAGITSFATGRPYEEELAYQRAANRAQDRESPVLYKDAPLVGDITLGGAAKLAGGVASGLGGVGAARAIGGPLARLAAPGTTAPRTIGKLAGTGAATGAVYGYGEGEGSWQDRGQNALLGTALGAVTGPVAYGVGAGLTKAWQGAKGAFNRGPDALRGMDPDAVRRVRTELELDDTSSLAGRNQNTGDRGMLFERGENLQGMAQGVATKPGPGKSIVVDALLKRRESSKGVLEDVVNRAMGKGEDIAITIQNAKDVARSAANPEYAAFRSVPIKYSPGTQQLIQRIEQAFPGIVERTRKNIANDPDIDPAMVKNGGHFLDELRQALSDAGYKKELSEVGKLDRGQVRNARSYARRLNGAIDAEVKRAGKPGVYKRARSTVEKLKLFEEGVDAGKGLLSKADMTPGAVAQLIKSKGKSEFAEGVRTAMREDIRREMVNARSVYGADAADALGVSKGLRAMSTSEARDKLKAAGFKPAQIKEMTTVADQEGQYLGTYGRIIGGSQTAERTAAQARVPDPPNLQKDMAATQSTTPTGMSLAAAKMAFAKVFQGEVDKKFADESMAVARMLVAQGADRDAILSALRGLTADIAKNDAQKRAVARVVARVARSLDDRALGQSSEPLRVTVTGDDVARNRGQ
jgi:hypothetical protein